MKNYRKTRKNRRNRKRVGGALIESGSKLDLSLKQGDAAAKEREKEAKIVADQIFERAKANQEKYDKSSTSLIKPLAGGSKKTRRNIKNRKTRAKK